MSVPAGSWSSGGAAGRGLSSAGGRGASLWGYLGFLPVRQQSHKTGVEVEPAGSSEPGPGGPRTCGHLRSTMANQHVPNFL